MQWICVKIAADAADTQISEHLKSCIFLFKEIKHKFVDYIKNLRTARKQGLKSDDLWGPPTD